MRLKEIGCENITLYNAIANYGYKFTKNGVHYDLRHILNDCGIVVNYFALNSINVHEKFYTWEETIDFIKKLK